MGSLRQDLLAAARAAVQDALGRAPLASRPSDYGIVLGGSAATEHADEYSGCDLFVFAFGAQDGPSDPWIWQTVRGARHPYRYTVLGLEGFLETAAAGDDGALYLIRHGQILHDPGGALSAAFAAAASRADELWAGKLAWRYRAFRQRRASLAWSLRRGQPLAVLDNLRLLLEHALCCGYHLQGEPAPPPKWLFGGGLRTAAGRGLREPVLALLSSLGELATLGGSLNLRHNRMYRRVEALQGALEAALLAAGHAVPGLASLAGDSGAAEDQSRAPRPLPRRVAALHAPARPPGPPR